MSENNGSKVLIVGGHGKVAVLATPKLVDAGFSVTSIFRNPDHADDIEKLGATPLQRDVTELSVDDWSDLLRDVDVIVWSAGNGGKNGADATYAIDRDAAIASIEGASALGENAPRYLMVSYVGSIDHTVDPDDSFYPYAESKKAADERLLASDLEFTILAPATLTLDNADGIKVIPNRRDATGGRDTSRELVADVICQLASRETLPGDPFLAFVDGEDPVRDI